ncbi:Phox/Bem1p [Corchorus olitorius]|uniref:Phox/Bem1p n=1 Tax=Corchorus olitorius TaxID=93759 RepID=A0A1R3H1C6_9ROSI|nr:Phox/Bem1p [Corchorus olitorius]
MCSYGGTIVPRPHDKVLCYIGGDTRMVVVDRHTSLASLHHRLSLSLLHGRPFTLKYQLPSEDLDSLISVTTDEDLENMIDEYDRTCSQTTPASKSSRIRLFLFPLNPEGTPATSHSIGPIINKSTKSDEWFLNALNGAGLLNRGFSDSATNVNCLLGLDDERQGNVVEVGLKDEGSGSQKNMNLKSQDVHSVPDSPMLETTSSFAAGRRIFGVVIATVDASKKPPPPQSQPHNLPLQSQQKFSSGHDLASPDSVSSDSSFTNPLSRQKPVIYQDPIVQFPSGANRVPSNPAHYIHHHPTAVPISAYYPVYPSQQQHHHPHHVQIDQQYPVYYVSARQPQAYNLPVQQSSISEAVTAIPSSRPQTPPNPTMVPSAAYNPMRNAPMAKPEVAAATGVYRTTTGNPQLVQVPNSQHQQPYVGYSQIHHPSQSVAPTSTAAATYAYEFTDPAHAQIYYTQPLAPTMPSQYQTMTAAAAGVLPDASAQLPTDNIKPQIRTSQPI